MTPNEARQVIESDAPVMAKRRDVLGKVARADMREACLTMARESIRRAHRLAASPSKRRNAWRAKWINMAAHWRRLAVKHSNQWSM